MFSYIMRHFTFKNFYIFTVLSTICGAAEFNATEFCGIVKNGTILKDPGSCNTWIECKNLKPTPHVCEKGLFYSLQTGACVDPYTVKCISSNPCAVLTSGTGFVPDPLSCKHYYYCNENVPTQGSCQNGGNYDPNTQTCIINSICNITLFPDSYCNIVPEGVFIKDSKNCGSYQYCWRNNLLNSSCPVSFYFDAFEGICTQNMTKACDLTTTAPPISKASACLKDGQFVSDGKTCNGYYYCKKNENNEYTLIHGTCPGQRFFSPSHYGVCVPRSQIVCEYDRCVGLGYKNIQLTNLSDDDCKGYGLCQNGVQIGQGLCPNNEYFDESKQRCTKTIISYPACITTAAKTKIP